MKAQLLKAAAVAAAGLGLSSPPAAHGSAIVHYALNETSGSAADVIGGVTMSPINQTAAEFGLKYAQPSVPAGTYGAVTLTPAQAANFGTAIAGDSRFPGFASFVSGNTPNALNTLAGPFTITAWVLPDTFDTIGRILAGTSVTIGTQKSGWGYGVLTSGRQRFTTYGVKDFDQSSGASAAQDVWQHVAVTYSATATTATVGMYLNGTLVQTLTGGPFQTVNPASRMGLFSTGTGSETFAGSIDDVWVYNNVLTQNEIRTAATGVEVISTPEPASAAVAGLVGLLALGRRRRAVAAG
ncbi:MAG: proteinsorting protein/Myxococcales trans [Phycisphaerales bacterium]|nr:proteinsorting protein/Myxococcales trans [Phycisphaerales bacterium]